MHPSTSRCDVGSTRQYHDATAHVTSRSCLRVGLTRGTSSHAWDPRPAPGDRGGAHFSFSPSFPGRVGLRGTPTSAPIEGCGWRPIDAGAARTGGGAGKPSGPKPTFGMATVGSHEQNGRYTRTDRATSPETNGQVELGALCQIRRAAANAA